MSVESLTSNIKIVSKVGFGIEFYSVTHNVALFAYLVYEEQYKYEPFPVLFSQPSDKIQALRELINLKCELSSTNIGIQ
uniref:MutS-like protein n=1 Tax=Romanomermis culicivorax TaxID=13658 RepID=A0A915JUA0_ROMCU